MDYLKPTEYSQTLTDFKDLVLMKNWLGNFIQFFVSLISNLNQL